MTPLERALVRIPAVYAELALSLLPGRSGEPSDSSPDPRHRPAPAKLDAVEHRHLLVKGLRWWVDAVADDTPLPVGDSVPRMCAVLLHHLPSMAPEDRDTLCDNLDDWLARAWGMVGSVAPPTRATLPLEALDAIVPVHVAAKSLGVSVSTVKRRAPGREGGQVRLRDVAGPECVMSDLPAAWCAHCVRSGA